MVKYNGKEMEVNKKSKTEQKASLECFQKKLSIEEYKKQLNNFLSIQSSKQENKFPKGIDNALTEISCLLSLAEYCGASHLKWTGEHTQNNPFDGVLYFNEKREQKIEIFRALDVKFKINMDEKGQANRDIDDESIKFIGHHIVKTLQKKNKQKYKDCWLAIAYDFPIISEITYLKFKEIESENKELLTSIRNIFNKIIFVPNREHFMKKKDSDFKTFKWAS